MSDDFIETTRQLAAQRQIDAAIDHFHKRQFECAITLAAAAESSLPEPSAPNLYRQLRDCEGDFDFNKAINWLKHSVKPDSVSIAELEVVVVIFRAISRFIAVYSLSSRRFDIFMKWAKTSGYFSSVSPEA